MHIACSATPNQNFQDSPSSSCEWADHVIVTQDNPRNEEPSEIVSQILAGVRLPNESGGFAAPEVEACADIETAADIEICHDRRRAIRHVLGRARKEDTVLIAGKGHETGQVIGNHAVPFDDRLEVEEWLCGR